MKMVFMISGTIIAFIIGFLLMPQFGKAPSGERKKKKQESPNYIDGRFQNIEYTPDFTEGYTLKDLLFKQFSTNKKKLQPSIEIPSIKTNLHEIDINTNILVWFGHSSYYIQLYGKRFLIDPVFSGKTSPLPFGFNSFKGTDIYNEDDMPQIDYLLITHDHYDHLDYKTIKQLKNKVKFVICGLGVGEHFERWNYNKDIIIEKDWGESHVIDSNITIYTETARHFSGQQFSRNNTLWLSFVLQTPSKNIFVGGDSGYGKHFKEIGEKYGEFDLVILENGQYNEMWEAIHKFPEQVLMASQDLKGKRVFPVHSGKFTLAFHQWDEPLNQIYEINIQKYNIPLATPIIGEVVKLNDIEQVFSQWWIQ